MKNVLDPLVADWLERLAVRVRAGEVSAVAYEKMPYYFSTHEGSGKLIEHEIYRITLDFGSLVKET